MQRTAEAPKIDGDLSDAVWQNAPVAKDFVQWNPDNGKAEPNGFESEVKILYDDEAIYFGAMLHDPYPDSILTELAQRDDNGKNADWFAVWINPYKDGLSDINFFITAAGVQIDSRTTDNGDDLNWNAVWKSEVRITEDGWIVELAIPYQALRFPETDIQSWALNIGRSIRRTRSTYTWSYINTAVGRPEIYAGILEGIENIESPVRLSLLPYVSGYVNRLSNVPGEGVSNSFDYNVGMDLKYGLSESFTLDMTLIPDFGQVRFDNQVLNLSPFEVRFNENRQFFTEGTELFNKGNMFYSRRIGDRPSARNDVYGKIGENEEVIENPNKVQLINATKVSGRTANNLGVGLFNAVTAETFARVRNIETGEIRRIKTEPIANYNVLVLDQRFGTNNSVTLVNTNVTRVGDFRDANSTGLLFDITDKENKYNLSGAYKQSLIWEDGEQKFGYATNLNLDKVYGNFRYWVGTNIESDTYNPNDLGFLYNNNEIGAWIGGSYRTFNPTKYFNSYDIGASISGDYLYNPRAYSGFNMSTWGRFTLKSFNTIGFNFWGSPIERNDWFEAREPGRVYKRMPYTGGSVWISTDYRKKFALDVSADRSYNEEHPTALFKSSNGGLRISPRFRFNDRFSLVVSARANKNISGTGFVGRGTGDEIFIGERDVTTVTNTIRGAYIFNPRMNINLSFRHYWSTVEYLNAYLLRDDGYLTRYGNATDFVADGSQDLNVNFWNIDLVYSWWFAPGSEISLVWKQAISSYGSELVRNYTENVQSTFEEPISNSFSIKVLYFLDGQKFIK